MYNWDFMFDPPERHEFCVCRECHYEDAHEDLKWWADEGCEMCEEELIILKKEEVTQ